jgi:hypothetical protein
MGRFKHNERADELRNSKEKIFLNFAGPDSQLENIKMYGVPYHSD